MKHSKVILEEEESFGRTLSKGLDKFKKTAGSNFKNVGNINYIIKLFVFRYFTTSKQDSDSRLINILLFEGYYFCNN